jgi:uncharacterized protein (TIGR00369 family)
MSSDLRADDLGTTGTRTRTYQWEDPSIPARAASRLSGLDVMRSLLAGELPAPPILQTLGFRLAEVGSGRVVFSVHAAEYMYNPIDSAAGCAVHTMLPVGARYTSLDLSVKFLRGMTVESGEVRCTGTVTHIGRRTSLAEARMTDENDRLLATATSSCLILPPAP